MDQLDIEILRALHENGKQNTKEVASKIGLTVTPTYERIKRLEQKGVIKKYVAILDKKLVGKEIIAYCQITLHKHQKEMIEVFKKHMYFLDEVMECHHVSGNFEFLLKVAVDNMGSFQVFINDKLATVDGISTIHSSFVMDSNKNTTVYTL